MKKNIRAGRIVNGFAKALHSATIGNESDFTRKRKETCKNCDNFQGGACVLCGCFIVAKSELKNEYCMDNKWNDIKIVKKVGVAVANKSENIVKIEHVDDTSTVDVIFKNDLELGKTYVFSLEIVNAKGDYYDKTIMDEIDIWLSCGSCSKIINKNSLPKKLSDGESFTLVIEFAPTTTGRNNKKATIQFNKKEYLYINYKSNVLNSK